MLIAPAFMGILAGRLANTLNDYLVEKPKSTAIPALSFRSIFLNDGIPAFALEFLALLWVVACSFLPLHLWLSYSLFGIAALLMARTDWEHRHLYNIVHVPLILASLPIMYATGYDQAAITVISSAGAMALLFLFSWIAKLRIGQHGSGFGDVILLGTLSLSLGWSLIPVMILLACLLALLYRLLSRCPKIPFGSFLSLSAMATMAFQWLPYDFLK